MPDPSEQTLSAFFTQLAQLPASLLLLDYDGTLAPFRENRLEAEPAEGIREVLAQIVETPGARVVLVTGRPCEEVLSLLRPARPLEVWGCHGREYRGLDGQTVIHGVTDAHAAALREARGMVEQLVDAQRVDAKTGCLALHWRGLPSGEQERIAREARAAWEPYIESAGLKILDFDGGIELAVPGRTKGDAVNALLEHVEVKRTGIAFLGDDLTDEDGFEALGERGLSVLVRNEPRPTSAQVRISAPQGILDFLHHWKAAIGKSGGASG